MKFFQTFCFYTWKKPLTPRKPKIEAWNSSKLSVLFQNWKNRWGKKKPKLAKMLKKLLQFEIWVEKWTLKSFRLNSHLSPLPSTSSTIKFGCLCFNQTFYKCLSRGNHQTQHDSRWLTCNTNTTENTILLKASTICIDFSFSPSKNDFWLNSAAQFKAESNRKLLQFSCPSFTRNFFQVKTDNLKSCFLAHLDKKNIREKIDFYVLLDFWALLSELEKWADLIYLDA